MLTNLRVIRQESLSQRTLAKQSGLTQNYLSLLEQGLPPRDPGHVAVLAAALRVSERLLQGPPLVDLGADRSVAETQHDA